MGKTIEILSNSTDQIIVLKEDKLPNLFEILELLIDEHTKLNTWIELAFAYYKKGDSDSLVLLLELSLKHASFEYEYSNKDQMRVLEVLIAFYVQMAHRQKNKDMCHEYFIKASTYFSKFRDESSFNDMNHILPYGFLCLLKSEKMIKANQCFNLILNHSSHNIPAIIGKAYVAFKMKNYKKALFYFKEVLRNESKCLVEVRLGLAKCFLKLKNTKMAKLSYDRALQLDIKCVDALVGLGLLELNSPNQIEVDIGIQYLVKAYNLDPTNILVSSHLSNQFLLKRNYSQSKKYAICSIRCAKTKTSKAESFFQLAKIYHIETKYDKAFQYYDTAIQLKPSKNFVLPYYGLGQLYIHRGDIENAVQCFEKVLEVYPENYDAIKCIGSLYANSEIQQKQDIAKNYLKKITKKFPEDIEAWIELAQVLEQSDFQSSLSAYVKAIELMRNSSHLVAPEILNNVAALNYKLGNLNESHVNLEEALSLLKKLIKVDASRFTSVMVTTKYNLARNFEALNKFQEAESLYQDILKEYPKYIDCYIRLGCLARDFHQIDKAFLWFNEALRIDGENADVWLLLGNLHIANKEWELGQQKIEHVLMNSSTSNDPYALTAIGNLWLHTRHESSKNKDLDKIMQNLALKFFIRALETDPKNIWATNGIGCILAYQNHINEASVIFNEIREATDDVCDVSLNIAHILMKKKKYSHAVQSYTHCMNKFFKHPNVDILKYLGVAYFKAGKLIEAKTVFLKALLVAPQDSNIIYNIALILQKLGTQTLEDETFNVKNMLQAENELALAFKYFQHLSIKNNHSRYYVTLAEFNTKQCRDLLTEAQHLVMQAQFMEMIKRDLSHTQKLKQKALQKERNEEQAKFVLQQLQKKEKILKSLEFKEKKKNKLNCLKNNFKTKSERCECFSCRQKIERKLLQEKQIKSKSNTFQQQQQNTKNKPKYRMDKFKTEKDRSTNSSSCSDVGINKNKKKNKSYRKRIISTSNGSSEVSTESHSNKRKRKTLQDKQNEEQAKFVQQQLQKKEKILKSLEFKEKKKNKLNCLKNNFKTKSERCECFSCRQKIERKLLQEKQIKSKSNTSQQQQQNTKNIPKYCMDKFRTEKDRPTNSSSDSDVGAIKNRKKNKLYRMRILSTSSCSSEVSTESNSNKRKKKVSKRTVVSKAVLLTKKGDNRDNDDTCVKEHQRQSKYCSIKTIKPPSQALGIQSKKLAINSPVHSKSRSSLSSNLIVYSGSSGITKPSDSKVGANKEGKKNKLNRVRVSSTSNGSSVSTQSFEQKKKKIIQTESCIKSIYDN